MSGWILEPTLLLRFRKKHQLHAVEGALLLSRKRDKVPGHCLNGFIVRPDFRNGSVHPDEWRGDSGQDSYSISDFKITHEKLPEKKQARRRACLENCEFCLISTAATAAAAAASAAKVSLDHGLGFVDRQRSSVEFCAA